MNTNTIMHAIKIDSLANLTDEALAVLCRVGQDNFSLIGDANSHAFAECVGREVITRWLLTASPVKPTPSAEEGYVKNEELERATAAVKSALVKLDSTASDAKDFYIFLKARAQTELLKTLSQLNAKSPDFDLECAHKSVSEARELIESLRNMRGTMNFLFGANKEGAGL